MNAARSQAETLRNALRGETRAAGNWASLVETLEDDFNTPAALALFHEWARIGALDELRRAFELFGLGSLSARSDAPADVVRLADARVNARAAKDFVEADRLRHEITEAGWEVRDAGDGYDLVPRS